MKTIKLFISLILLFLLTFNLHSQIGSIAVKGIYNVSFVSYSGTSSKSSLNSGVFIDYNIGKYFRLSLDASSLNKGIKLQAYTINNVAENVETNLNFISIALPLKFGQPIVINKKLKKDTESYFYPYIFGGPRIDINTNQDENRLNGLYAFQNKINFGASLGIGFILYQKKGLLAGGEVRFSPDFNTSLVEGYTYKGQTVTFIDNTRFRNQSFELSAFIGITF